MNQSTYTVQSGDTLYGISRQHNTSAQRIRELNNLTSDNLVPGQVLIVSDNDATNPSECVIYTVEAGDSLYEIANKYDTTADLIKEYNGLESNDLSIGQELRIPCYIEDNDNSDLPKYVNYTVEVGDNLYDIAEKFGTTVDKIKKDNDLKSNTLTVGTMLIIDDKKKISSIEECYGQDVDVPLSSTYVVQSGDSLYSIAKKFGTTADKIKQLNNLNNNILSVGQEIVIPSVALSEVTIYKVQSGDNLYDLAKKFGTSVSELKDLNNLKSDSLSINQELKVPAVNIGETTYTVKSGDSLYSVAKKFNTSVDSLKKKNGLGSTMLSIGQVLKI